MDAMPSRRRTLSRKEAVLVALGLGAWVAIGLGGAWLYHQFTRPAAACGTALEGKSTPTKAAAGGPRNGLQLLTGTGRCS